MEYNIDECLAYLRAHGVSNKSARLIERLVKRLGWDTFYTAPVAQLNSAYRAERPHSHVTVSKQGQATVNAARQWMHDKRYNLTVDLHNKEAEKQRDKTAAEKEAEAKLADAERKLKEAEAKLAEAKALNRVFDAKWIKKLADFMELEGLEYVDLFGVNLFVDMFRGSKCNAN